MRRAIYRNLNLAKRDPSRYVYSIATVKGTASKGTVEAYEYGTMYAVNCTPKVLPGGLLRVRNQGQREVFAWIVGDIVETPIAGEAVRLTFDPWKHGEFTIKETGKAADFSQFRAVKFTDTGTFGIL